ncbi:rhomboid family intramembrane serine protease [Candidatus Methanocrinis natronophilus]|uniref:Rhomboid family intramembrane serine protease n=1 Tax=Candidatus Methanocrinis natronophilus TaxID=3033396 RepID=A0ABT5X5U0_9EURY|nr:rhomboid family intramembrane serine protease [Candidatus Methanocrinis natronophilus]MDF0590023.1 rhomboid family intramembrane serine protease [Candidatus Methanocrinis natronophilus]
MEVKELIAGAGRARVGRLSLLAGWQKERGRDDRWNDPDPWDEDRTSSSGRLNLPVTYSGIILIICVLVFLISNAFPTFTNNYLELKPAFLAAHPWTIITHMFVHADMAHLFFNMLFLFFFGMELERRVGESKFLQIFIISGIVAAIGQMAVLPAESLVGASGALFGVMGCLAVIAPEISVLLFFFIPLSIRAAIVLLAVIDFAFMGSETNIAHMAHITGLLVGLAYGGLLKDRYRYRYR